MLSVLSIRWSVGLAIVAIGWPVTLPAATEGTLDLASVGAESVVRSAEIGASGSFTWWLPPHPDAYVLPIAGGVEIDAGSSDLVAWLRRGSPWPLVELPAFGLRYGETQLVVVVPWPHYAELVVAERVGVRFTVPPTRRRVAPAEIVVVRETAEPLRVAHAFRRWRREAESIGALPRPRSLRRKATDLPRVERLFGAPHIYLWGPAAFSRHAVARKRWTGFAHALVAAPEGHVGRRLVARFTPAQRRALDELAASEWPVEYLVGEVAAAIDQALGADADAARDAMAEAFGDHLGPSATWGDGPSAVMIASLHAAGVDRALLVLSDLYGRAELDEVATLAERHGFLLGPYDSYHSVHSPEAAPDDTWETAQFDAAAFHDGRILDEQGAGRAGFRGRGFHFAPAAAWPYVQRRVGGLLERTPYSAWFVDCDATAEVFDDFSPTHPATRLDDVDQRRRRLRWLESEHSLVVGSEGGSALFSDVVHFGHGVHAPYIGHLAEAFRDRSSPHYLGRHWPPDQPDLYFRPVPLPPSLESPWFDPALRVPLYRAALGDEVIATHHWNFGSFKLAGLDGRRQLLEVLYMVPPLYHLNRATWAAQSDRILRHLEFWSPLHQRLAPSPLTRFEVLSEDRSVQRTTYETADGPVTITVNFADAVRRGHPPLSATVRGAGAPRVFRVTPEG